VCNDVKDYGTNEMDKTVQFGI